MPGTQLVVRPVETEEELDAFFLLQAQTWQPNADPIATARRFRDWELTSPAFDPRQLRGAFIQPQRDAGTHPVLAGAAIVSRRDLRLPPASLPTACVGGVVAHPDFRNRGVGRALIDDAVAFSRQRRDALLLLDGIAGFYHKWAFVDIWDLTEHFVNRAHILRLSPGSYSVRPATEVDASAVLDLYDRHYGARTGSFTRSLVMQQRRLSQQQPGNELMLALDLEGQPRGYLLLTPTNPARAAEVAADDWSAALALLQYHARRLDDEAEPPSELRWALPPDSTTLYLVLDNIASAPGAEADRRADPEALSTRSVTYQLPDGQWMARPAARRVLLQSLLPRWRTLLQRGRSTGTGALSLVIDDETFTIEVAEDELRLLPTPHPDAELLRLSDAAFVQLLFSYRTLDWAIRQPDLHIPSHLVSLLVDLFPHEHPWIPFTDWF